MKCINCGQPIAEARLKAIPWTKNCITCAEEIDRKHQEIMQPITDYCGAMMDYLTEATEGRKPQVRADAIKDNQRAEQRPNRILDSLEEIENPSEDVL